ncbi:hypothetical protein ACTVCO_07730 [Sanguibacter sp. A247]|uniref:hypothetical protein n=1 Tax=unclassified Sanguibacter TaxID=2645534 RepID=UPI003FD729E8
MPGVVTFGVLYDVAQDPSQGRAGGLERELAVLELILDRLRDVRQPLSHDDDALTTRLGHRRVRRDDVHLVAVDEISGLHNVGAALDELEVGQALGCGDHDTECARFHRDSATRLEAHPPPKLGDLGALEQGWAPAADDHLVGVVNLGASLAGATTRGDVRHVQAFAELGERLVHDESQPVDRRVHYAVGVLVKGQTQAARSAGRDCCTDR